MFSGWAAIGHFITLDEELPDGWANPEGSRLIWYGSVAEFLIKAALFGTLIATVYLN